MANESWPARPAGPSDEGNLFGGHTAVPAVEDQDLERLGRLLDRVRATVLDGRWHRLAELAETCGGSEASVSARLRDLRKLKNGGHRVERRRVKGGLFEYRVALSQDPHVR